jgi:hypothetical protein
LVSFLTLLCTLNPLCRQLNIFFAGVFSFIPCNERDMIDYENTLYHIHTLIFKALETNPSEAIGKNLLSTIEVARGEICEIKDISFMINKINKKIYLFFCLEQ